MTIILLMLKVVAKEEDRKERPHKNTCNHGRGESKVQSMCSVQSHCAAKAARREGKVEVGHPRRAIVGQMLQDVAENSLPEELPPLAMFFTRLAKGNFGFAAWENAIFDPATWTAFKRNKPIRIRIAKSRLPYISAIAPAFTRERYQMEDSKNIRDLAFRALAEYNTIAHVHKKMKFFGNFEAFHEYYVKLRARFCASSSSIRALRAERGAALARESQPRASDDEMDWRAPSPENSNEADSVDYEDEEDE